MCALFQLTLGGRTPQLGEGYTLGAFFKVYIMSFCGLCGAKILLFIDSHIKFDMTKDLTGPDAGERQELELLRENVAAGGKSACERKRVIHLMRSQLQSQDLDLDSHTVTHLYILSTGEQAAVTVSANPASLEGAEGAGAFSPAMLSATIGHAKVDLGPPIVATGVEVDLVPSIVASPAVLEQAQAQGRAEMERELAQYKALGSQGQRAAGAGATSSLPKLKKADTGVAKQMADLKAAERAAAARGDYDGARDLQNQYKALENQGAAAGGGPAEAQRQREAAAAAEAKGQAEEEAKRQGAATSSVEQEHSGSTLGLGWNTGLGFRL